MWGWGVLLEMSLVLLLGVVALGQVDQVDAANVLAGLKKVGDIWHDTVLYLGGIFVVGGLIFTGAMMLMHHQMAALLSFAFALIGGAVILFADDIVNGIRPASAAGAIWSSMPPDYLLENLKEMAQQLVTISVLTEWIRHGRRRSLRLGRSSRADSSGL